MSMSTDKFTAGTKIVIVEDDKFLGGLVSKKLVEDGCVVEHIERGELAKAAIDTVLPDLIFLDVLMPRMTGPQVLAEIGQQRSGKVILISAFSGEHNMQTALQMGADLFIPKPFDDIFAIVTVAEDLAK